MILLVPPAEAGKNCVCKANGRDYHEGDIACIRGRLSRCEMFLNNTSWKKIADDCPEVKLQPKGELLERLRAMHGTPPPEAC
jgi:hypothetical protein